jgi:hypothetical protein
VSVAVFVAQLVSQKHVYCSVSKEINHPPFLCHFGGSLYVDSQRLINLNQLPIFPSYSIDTARPIRILTTWFFAANVAMQLYHHPYSLDSQKVRIALEEKGIDYTSYHVNPLTGKNMNVDFFRMNPSAKLPVFQNGAHVIFRAIDIIQ